MPRFGMKRSAGGDTPRIGHDQLRRIIQIDGRFAVEAPAPEAAHLDHRAGAFDGDVIVRRLKRERLYLCENDAAGEAGDRD
jgi:hypothetical protein